MAAMVAATLVACTTVTNPKTGATTKVPDVVQMEAIAQSAAFIGTTVWLNGIEPNVAGHPQDRPQFELARTSLRALIAGGEFSAADLTAALQSLPVAELKGDTGSLIVGEAVTLWDVYGQQLASLDKAQVFRTYILGVAKAILTGLDQAMGPPLPAPVK